MEVADHGNVHLGNDGGHGAGRFIGVHRHAHQLAAGRVQRAHLRGRRGGIGGVGIGHRLDDDRLGAAHRYAAHGDRHGGASRAHGDEI